MWEGEHECVSISRDWRKKNKKPLKLAGNKLQKLDKQYFISISVKYLPNLYYM